jgi:hypothetical protein
VTSPSLLLISIPPISESPAHSHAETVVGLPADAKLRSDVEALADRDTHAATAREGSLGRGERSSGETVAVPEDAPADDEKWRYRARPGREIESHIAGEDDIAVVAGPLHVHQLGPDGNAR